MKVSRGEPIGCYHQVWAPRSPNELSKTEQEPYKSPVQTMEKTWDCLAVGFDVSMQVIGLTAKSLRRLAQLDRASDFWSGTTIAVLRGLDENPNRGA